MQCLVQGETERKNQDTSELVARICEHEQTLTPLLRKSNDWAWRAVEIALAGTTWWHRCRTELEENEQPLSEQVGQFLAVCNQLGFPQLSESLTQRCREELQAVRRSGVLFSDVLDCEQLVRQAYEFTPITDRKGNDACWQLITEMAKDLPQRGQPSVAKLIGFRLEHSLPLMVVAARFFFCREVQNHAELSKVFSVLAKDSLPANSEAGLSALAGALHGHSYRLVELLGKNPEESFDAEVVEDVPILHSVEEEVPSVLPAPQSHNDALPVLPAPVPPVLPPPVPPPPMPRRRRPQRRPEPPPRRQRPRRDFRDTLWGGVFYRLGIRFTVMILIFVVPFVCGLPFAIYHKFMAPKSANRWAKIEKKNQEKVNKAEPITKAADIPNLLQKLTASQDKQEKLQITARFANTWPMTAEHERHRQATGKAMETLLTDRDAKTRILAAKALTRWGDKENVPTLIQVVGKDRNGDVRFAAMDTLAELQDPRAIQPISKRVSDLWDGKHAFPTLLKFGPAAESEVATRLANDANSNNKRKYIEALGKIGTHKSISILRLFENNVQLRGPTSEAIRSIRQRETGQVIGLLQGPGMNAAVVYAAGPMGKVGE